jgi:hypothetical protein
MRKQYHFRRGPDGLRAWDVHRLVELAKDLPVIYVEIPSIKEIDEPYWYGEGAIPTCRSVAEHAKLSSMRPILIFRSSLSSSGRVMDGMHRVAKAAMQNVSLLPAKQF